MGEAAIVDGLAKALGLPRPFPHEPNRAFTTCESWQQLAAAMAAQPLAVRPLGYYRTPDSVDIYVFEIRLGTTDADRKCWKIYRRYRQFHKYVSSSSELLSSMVVPRLSQAYLKLFSAQTCTARLEELHAWLQGVADNTQAYCRQQAAKQDAEDVAKADAKADVKADVKRLEAAADDPLSKPRVRRCGSSAGEKTTATAASPPKRTRAASTLDSSVSTASAPVRDQEEKKLADSRDAAIADTERKRRQRERTATFYRLRMDSVAARPLLLLSCFLLSGANVPFPHVFRGLPRFALALEEINVEVKPRGDKSKAGVGVFPSRVRSSLATRAGLGLRLAPTHEQDGAFFGAAVSGFSRELGQVDPRLVRVPIGARLVRVNGVDTANERFEAILGLLSASGRRPLRMRFVHNPYATSRPQQDAGTAPQDAGRRSTASFLSRGSFVDANELFGDSSSASAAANGVVDRPVRTESAVDAVGSTLASAKLQDDATARSYSVDARPAASLLGSVFGDLFGRKRVDTADQALADRHKLQPAPEDAPGSWDDAGGAFFDILSRGFYTPLPPALLRELRDKRRRLKLGEDVLLYPSKSSVDGQEQEQEEDKRRAQGVWSTAAGPLGLCLGACKVCGKEAAMLELSPAVFSSRPMGSEQRLRKGFVLVSINSESTFGWSFARVAAALAAAPRPTAIAFRWFRDYSPFLESDVAEKTGGSSADEADAFATSSGLDCVAEAQADLSASLHLALVENASVRDAMAAQEAAASEARVKLAAAERATAALEAKLRATAVEMARMEQEGVRRAHQLDKWRQRATEAEEKLATARQEAAAAAERARSEAMAKVAEQEERLVRESNRSIANANALAERKTHKLLDATVLDMQRRHDEYLQKLAEEHSEEVESLQQQVAVWRHQVEVLTEAEKRNYAALVHSGINPYGGAHRSRFGLDNDLASDDFGRGSQSNYQSQASRTAAGRASGSASRPAAGKKEPVFSAVGSNGSSASSGASQSQPGTFWDRMVSLIAAE